MKKIIVLILISLMFANPVIAGETGTVRVNKDSYRQDVVAPFEVTTRSPDWGMLLIDYPNFNKVSNISIDMRGQMTYNKESNYTTFTITQNGSGTGVISYSKALDRVNYVFSDDSVFTGVSVNLTFAYPIMNDTRITTANKTSGNMPAPTYQLCVNIVRSSTGGLTCLTGNTFAIAYEYIKTETSSVSYTTTYENNLAGLFFTISVDKSQSGINNKVKLHSATQTYQNETTFNQNNLYFAGPYLDGLYLNLSIQSGAYNDALINATGAPGSPPAAPETNQVNITKPSTGANIAFDKAEYIIGDNTNVSWYYSDTEWNNLLTLKKIDFKINGNYRLDEFGAHIDDFVVSSQTGYKIIQADTVGTIEAEANTCTLLVFCSTLGTDNANVLAPGESWIALSNYTVYAKVPFNATYHIGFSMQNYPPASIEIQTIDSATGNKVDNVFPDTFPDGTIPIGVIHPLPAGEYSIRLYDSVKNTVLDIKKLTVILQPSAIPTMGITTSSISTDKSVYFYNDYMQISFQVDDANFTNYSIRGDILNRNTSTVTKRIFAPFNDQVGTYTTIVNIDKKQKCESGLNCWFDIGNNSINLVAYNSTDSFTIAYANFTVSSTTSDGYGLQVSTITPSANIPFQITTIVPSLHTGTLIVANDGYKKIVYVANQTVASGTYTIPVTISPVNNNGVAYYVAELWGDDGYLKVKIPLTVSQPSATATTATASGTTNQVTSFLSSNIFWALVFIIGFMLAIAVFERKGK